MGKKHNDCRYFKKGWCSYCDEPCNCANDPNECEYYEASDLGKSRTIERDRNRKAKSERYKLDMEN